MIKRNTSNLKMINFAAFILLTLFTITGCGGGGGGGGDTPPTNNPPQTGGNNWDTLIWDQGSWE